MNTSNTSTSSYYLTATSNNNTVTIQISSSPTSSFIITDCTVLLSFTNASFSTPPAINTPP